MGCEPGPLRGPGTGGAIGLVIGFGLAVTLTTFVPGLPIDTPPEYVIAALTLSAATGLLSGVAPARRAARLDPVEALRAE